MSAKVEAQSSVWDRIKGVFLGPGSLTDFGERYLILDRHWQTSVRGMYAIGDVAGTPDIKAALNAGYLLGQHLASLPRRSKSQVDVDVAIIGAGPAGINAASELAKVGKKVVVIERKALFQTIRAFANSKALFLASTGDPQILGDFPFRDCAAEECITEWDEIVEGKGLDIRTQTNVTEIKQRDAFEVWTKGPKGAEETILADRVIVAIGKPRLLEKLSFEGAADQRIQYRLRADGELSDKDVLVVAHAGSYEGFEMALDLAPNNRVTLIYEDPGEPQVSPDVAERIEAAAKAGRLRYIRGGQLSSIDEGIIHLKLPPKDTGVLGELGGAELETALGSGDPGQERREKLKNDVIFTGKIIDRELPVSDLRRFGLNVERRMSPWKWVGFMALFAFFAFVYISKSGGKAESLVDFGTTEYLLDAQGQRTAEVYVPPPPPKDAAELVANPPAPKPPTVKVVSGVGVIGLGFIKMRGVTEAVFRAIASELLWTIVFGLGLFALAVTQIRQTWKAGFGRESDPLNKALLGIMVLAVGLVAFGPMLILRAQGSLALYQVWAMVYSAGIVIYGFRAIFKYRTEYRDGAQGSHQTRKLLSLMVFQVLFLAILPEVIFQNWRSYGFVLAWPLNLNPSSYAGFIDTQDSQVLHIGGEGWPVDGRYWVNRLYFSWTLLLSFGLIPLLVWRKGMRYCTWICSCGGLAETVGDEWRKFSPKGPANTKREVAMYVVLGITGLIMALAIAEHHGVVAGDLGAFVRGSVKGWAWIVDLAMCGVLPLVLYPFMSGRTWCRYACPTAGFMKLLGRKATVTGIQPDRKRCIACGMCDRFCEVGVPIRKHALKGQYFSANDTTCISCGVCISVCPTDVLKWDMHPDKRVLPMAV